MEPNDSGSTGSYGGYNPIDPGDNGNDPLADQAPGVPCIRTGKVASTSASINVTGETITFNLSNAYPGYHPTIFFGIANQWNTPGIVSSITLTNPNPSLLTMTLKGTLLVETEG